MDLAALTIVKTGAVELEAYRVIPELLGRWVGSFTAGRFVHSTILETAPVSMARKLRITMRELFIMSRLRGSSRGPEFPKTAAPVGSRALRLIRAEVEILNSRETDLIALQKNAPEKVRIALRLRKETTMTLKLVAQHLHIGTKTHPAHLLYWNNRQT